jgi:hypothetical protein
MCDGSCDELLAFGRTLGLKDEWLQRPGTAREHFDLPTAQRARAIELGAVAVSPQEIVRRCVWPKLKRSE